jgi:signal transduction histidine kinase
MFEFVAVALILLLSGAVVFLIKRLRKMSSQHDDRLALLSQLSEENRALLSILFHDLGTPLTVLEFAARRIQSETKVEDDPIRFEKNIQKMLQALSLMRELLSKVKSLQEVRSGKKPLNLEGVDPVAVTKEVIELFEERLLEKHLEIRLESYLEENCAIQADRTLLKHEVLANLISNAIKFSPENRIIEIYLLREDKNHVLIQIRDYGIGIPWDLMPRIFDFNAKTTRLGTKDEVGTGFGLPLVKTCTLLMSGSIDVETFSYEAGVSGPGTSFNLRFLTSDSELARTATSVTSKIAA